MKIYFARHGESQANLLHVISNRSLPHGLTHQGRKQAEGLVAYLKQSTINRIYSSPVPRAVETSYIVAKSLGLTYEIVDALREVDCGILEGRSDKAAWQQWQELHDAWLIEKKWSFCMEGGESFHQVCQRFIPFIQELVNKYASTADGILCISHGGIYRLMLPLVIKNLDETLMSRYGFGYTSCLVAEVQIHGLVCVAWNGEPINVESTFD
jgi:broad specificity phosphatase PhoE